MGWPARQLDTTHFDSLTDSPAGALPMLRNLINNVKDILSARGRAGGVCDLDSAGKVPASRLRGGGSITTAERAKLAGIEARATADQTGAQIRALLDATLGGSAWRTPTPVMDRVFQGDATVRSTHTREIVLAAAADANVYQLIGIALERTGVYGRGENDIDVMVWEQLFRLPALAAGATLARDLGSGTVPIPHTTTYDGWLRLAVRSSNRKILLLQSYPGCSVKTVHLMRGRLVGAGRVAGEIAAPASLPAPAQPPGPPGPPGAPGR